MRVGTSELLILLRTTQKDHPHACGDKRLLKDFSQREKGSSPCVWGQVYEDGRFLCFDGIIPMRVGTSIQQAVNDYRTQDHPHACGDKINRLLSLSLCLGSSPCVWGQAPPCIHLFELLRIIPMRVGTSAFNSALKLAALDHPHACGDKSSSAM